MQKNLNKKLLAVAISSVCAFGAVASSNISINNPSVQDQDDNRYIVKFKEHDSRALFDAADKAGISVAEARLAANTKTLAAYGAEMALNLNSINAAAVKLNKSQLSALRNSADVEFIEVDPKRYLIESVSTSEVSPMAESNPYGVAMVQADQVSDANTGNMSVCITDTGYDGNHEDLLPHTSSLITGDDNDGLGNDTGNWWEPGHSHGTHVAGTIGALGNNGVGVTSVNPSGLLKMHNVKIFNNSGNWAYGSDLVKAIEQCQAAGSNIISMSIGGGASSEAERSAFESAANAGMLHIAAAGNDGNSSLSYPASYDEVMSVGALNSSKTIASFSQYNSQVEIAAPGVAVNSTIINNSYASWDGTSMATPHVSGVAALVWSHYPQCNAAQIRNALIATAEDLGNPGRDNYYGHGLVQAKAMYDALAVTCDIAPPPPPPPPVVGELQNGVAETISGAGGSETFWTFDTAAGAVAVNMSGGTGDADLYVKFGSEATTSSYDCRPYASGNNEECTFAQSQAGTYHVMVHGYSAYSNASLVATYDDGGSEPPTGGDSGAKTDISIASKGWDRTTINVAEGASNLVVSTSGGTGNVRLYLRQGTAPTTKLYDCRSRTSGNDESCTIAAPAAGEWHIGIKANKTATTGLNMTWSYE